MTTNKLLEEANVLLNAALDDLSKYIGSPGDFDTEYLEDVEAALDRAASLVKTLMENEHG